MREGEREGGDEVNIAFSKKEAIYGAKGNGDGSGSAFASVSPLSAGIILYLTSLKPCSFAITTGLIFTIKLSKSVNIFSKCFGSTFSPNFKTV
jgi:hypothetical protein